MAMANPQRLPIPPPPQCLSRLLDTSPLDWNCSSRVEDYHHKGDLSYSPAPFVYIHYPQLVLRSADGRHAGKGVHVWYNALQGTCQTTPPAESVEVEWVHDLPWPWRRVWSWEASKWYIFNTQTEQSRWTLEGCDELVAMPLARCQFPLQNADEGVQMQPSQPSGMPQLSQLSQPPSGGSSTWLSLCSPSSAASGSSCSCV